MKLLSKYRPLRICRSKWLGSSKFWIIFACQKASCCYFPVDLIFRTISNFVSKVFYGNELNPCWWLLEQSKKVYLTNIFWAFKAHLAWHTERIHIYRQWFVCFFWSIRSKIFWKLPIPQGPSRVLHDLRKAIWAHIPIKFNRSIYRHESLARLSVDHTLSYQKNSEMTKSISWCRSRPFGRASGWNTI